MRKNENLQSVPVLEVIFPDPDGVTSAIPPSTRYFQCIMAKTFKIPRWSRKYCQINKG